MASNITVDTLSKGGTTLNTDEIVDTNSNQICKAWVNFNGNGTVAIRDSHNVSSITDNGVGDYTINFTNNMANTNYAINLASANGAVRQFILAGNDTVGSYRVRTQSSSGGQSNASYVYSTVFGD